MSIYTIQQGNHYDNRLFSSCPFISSEPSIKRWALFDASCAYTLPAYNTEDVNKLFGLCFGIRGIHYNSARFGWRYSRSGNCIQILAYVYRKGIRNQDEQLRFPLVATVQVGEPIELELESDAQSYRFYSRKPGQEQSVLSVPHERQLQFFGLTASLYFGGSQVAPQTMKIMMSRNPIAALN